MSLPTKVALWTFGLVMLAASLALAVSLERGAAQHRRDFRRQTAQLLEILALSSGRDLAAGRHDRIQSSLDNIANFPSRFEDVRDIDVIDREGVVVADMDPRRFGLPTRDPQARRDVHAKEPIVRPKPDGSVDYVVPINLAYPLGVLRANVSEARLDRSVREEIVQGVVLMGTMALLLALTLWLVLKWTISDRIVGLAGAAARFRAGKMDVRFTAEGTDEIASLGDSFNTMGVEIQRYTANLEALVDDRTDELRKANEQLVKLATTDPLTTLFNRRYFRENAERDLEIAKRRDRSFSVIVCDLDHFKTVNDTHGHAAGDAVLRAFSDLLKGEARAVDIVARVGGEEFAIAMPDTALKDATNAAERLRAALSGAEPLAFEGAAIKTTASFGVATFPEHGQSLDDLVSLADRALYAAKHGGRNRVVVAQRRSQAPAGVA